MWYPIRSHIWLLPLASKSRSPYNVSDNTSLSPQPMPILTFLLFSGNASSFLPWHLPCSFFYLKHFIPRNLLAPSLFQILSKEAFSDQAGKNSSLPKEHSLSVSVWFFSKWSTFLLYVINDPFILSIVCLLHSCINSKKSGNLVYFVLCTIPFA